MTVRLAGVLVGLVLIAIGILRRRRRAFSRGDLLLWAGLGLVVVVLSLAPGTADTLGDILRLENRLFAVLVVALGGLVVLALRQRIRITRLETKFGQLVRSLAVRDFVESRDAEAERNAVAIVIAAYNEEEAIAGVLSDLPLEVEGYEVDPIVVVDGGTDDTEGVVARAGYSVATHHVNRGQGDALRTGFAIALQRGDEIVVTMDADGQHRPDELPALIKPIVAGEADYVQGSRFLGAYDDAGGSRELGIKLFAWIISTLSDARISDCTNGYRAIRAEKLALMRLEQDSFSAAEIIMEAATRGLRMKEVPVHIRSRSHGDSKKPPRLGYPLGYLRTIIAVWLR